MSLRTRQRRRAGLTLIELIVVLTILIALGGIAAAVAPDLLGTAHVAEHATNATTVESAVQINRFTTSGTIGDRFDSLVETGGANVYDGLPSPANYTPYTLGGAGLNPDADADALVALGVTSVFEGVAFPALPAAQPNATFEYADYTALPTPVATGGELCSLDLGNVALVTDVLSRFNALDPATLGPVAGSQYLLLGVGPGCTLVGANGAIAEAPVHFADSATGRADVAYARYVVVVELQSAGTDAAEARMLGVGVLHDDGPARAGQALAEFYE